MLLLAVDRQLLLRNVLPLFAFAFFSEFHDRQLGSVSSLKLEPSSVSQDPGDCEHLFFDCFFKDLPLEDSKHPAVVFKQMVAQLCYKVVTCSFKADTERSSQSQNITILKTLEIKRFAASESFDRQMVQRRFLKLMDLETPAKDDLLLYTMLQRQIYLKKIQSGQSEATEEEEALISNMGLFYYRASSKIRKMHEETTGEAYEFSPRVGQKDSDKANLPGSSAAHTRATCAAVQAKLGFFAATPFSSQYFGILGCVVPSASERSTLEGLRRAERYLAQGPAQTRPLSSTFDHADRFVLLAVAELLFSSLATLQKSKIEANIRSYIPPPDDCYPPIDWPEVSARFDKRKNDKDLQLLRDVEARLASANAMLSRLVEQNKLQDHLAVFLFVCVEQKIAETLLAFNNYSLEACFLFSGMLARKGRTKEALRFLEAVDRELPAPAQLKSEAKHAIKNLRLNLEVSKLMSLNKDQFGVEKLLGGIGLLIGRDISNRNILESKRKIYQIPGAAARDKPDLAKANNLLPIEPQAEQADPHLRSAKRAKVLSDHLATYLERVGSYLSPAHLLTTFNLFVTNSVAAVPAVTYEGAYKMCEQVFESVRKDKSDLKPQFKMAYAFLLLKLLAAGRRYTANVLIMATMTVLDVVETAKREDRREEVLPCSLCSPQSSQRSRPSCATCRPRGCSTTRTSSSSSPPSCNRCSIAGSRQGPGSSSCAGCSKSSLRW